MSGRLFLFVLFCIALVFSAAWLRADPPPATRGGTLMRLNDFGSDDIAYFAIPVKAPHGGVVVVHDTYGLTEAVKDQVDRLARAGYIAVAPDLFNGETAVDAVRAQDLRGQVDAASARKTIAAAVSFLRDSPRFRAEKVALAGYGMGAPLAFQTATDSEHSIVEAVALIGSELPTDKEALKHLSVPLLCVTDPKESTPENRAQFEAALKDLHKTADLHLLPANKTAAQQEALAQKELLAFLTEAFSAKPRQSFFQTEWNRVFPPKPGSKPVYP